MCLSVFPGLKYLQKTHYLRFVCRTALGFVVPAVKTLTSSTNPVKIKKESAHYSQQEERKSLREHCFSSAVHMTPPVETQTSLSESLKEISKSKKHLCDLQYQDSLACKKVKTCPVTAVNNPKLDKQLWKRMDVCY